MRQLSGKCYTFCFLLLMLLWQGSLAAANITLKVRLFTGKSLTQISISPVKGSYSLKSGGKTLTALPLKSSCMLSLENGKIKVTKGEKTFGSATTMTIEPANGSAILRLKVGSDDRSYEGAFSLKIVNGEIQLINRIELEKYVAGVVESEGGDARNTEFYKLQCLITRTYAMKNIRKHEAEGFQFCDQVHCQHYKNRGRYMEILAARDATRGKVIVDSAGRLINAAFHANSGGETVSSESVWSYKETYLKAMTDTFSLSMTKTLWEKSYKTTDFLNILQEKYAYPSSNPAMRDSALQFTQKNRKYFFPGGISLKTLRSDLELRSTFFSIEEKGDSVLIHGKGFGHGVGLSQEGALRMARLGYTCDQILDYYYRNVSIKSLTNNMK